MRILHTADLHIESAMTSKLPADKVRIRREELQRNFEKMVEEAKILNVQLFIIAGDLFDSEKVSRKATERIANIIERTPQIDFLYLSGNHEKSGFIEQIQNIPKNLKLFSNTWQYYNYENITLAGINETYTGMFSDLNLSPSRKNIVILHGVAVDHCCEGGYIGLSDAKEKNIDYMALGHYHTYGEKKIDNRGVAVYCGTPEGRGFDETGAKGFVLIDIEDDNLAYKFIPFANRKLQIVDVDITGCARRFEIESRIAEKLNGISSRDLVRVRLIGDRETDVFCDTGAVVSRWGDSFFYFEIQDETKLSANLEDFRYDKSLKGEFIRLVLSKDDLSDEEKEKIIKCGIGALMNDLVDL